MTTLFDTRVPPQNWVRDEARSNMACHGQEPGRATVPPTMRECGRRPQDAKVTQRNVTLLD